MQIKYFRGLRANYNIVSHGNGIYFATDTKEIIQNGISFLGDLPAELAEAIKRIEENENALVILNGEGEGSVKKAVELAINDFATKISDNKVVDTFKELVDYAAENAADLGDLVVRVKATEDKNAAQDLRLDAIEAIDNVQNDRLTILEELIGAGNVEGTDNTLISQVAINTQEIGELRSDVDANSAVLAELNGEGENSIENKIASRVEEALSWEVVE